MREGRTAEIVEELMETLKFDAAATGYLAMFSGPLGQRPWAHWTEFALTTPVQSTAAGRSCARPPGGHAA